ncbi:MAG: diaminopimelate decarboxylase/aspartate kinase [Polyangiales bacterium]
MGALFVSNNLRTKFTVLKFGGTSVADADNWQRIACLVREAQADDKHHVLVCSAVAGVTDALKRLVARAAAEEDPREVLAEIVALHQALADGLALDATTVLRAEFADLEVLASRGAVEPSSAMWQAQVFSMGELMSTRLAAHWLQSVGVDAQWVDARELLRANDQSDQPVLKRYLSAECDYSPSAKIQQRLLREETDVTVTQGFIASNDKGETVLLGRGGSDTSAACIACVLEADRLEIWTDVPGLFTSDPRRASTARLVPRLTYDEAAVLGSLGAKVLHPRCLAPVKAANIPLHIRWTQRPEVAGTIINGRAVARGVRAVTARHELCLVVMRRPREWQPIGFMAKVAACFERQHISMDLVSSSASEIRATIDLAANPSASELLGDLIADLGAVCEPELHEEVMCVSIVGTEISCAMGEISACLSLFTKSTIHLVTHAADDSHISFVLDRALGPTLVSAVHDAIFASQGPTTLGAQWSSLQSSPAPQAQVLTSTSPGAVAAMEVAP